MEKKFAVSLAIVLLSVGSALAQSDYAQAIEKWRGDRENNLKKESGWLSLAGLFWLKEGVNTVGTGPQFDVRLTDNFKGATFGEIDFENGVAKLKVASGVEATCDGKPVSTIDLVPDEKGKPTELRVGSQMFYLIRREDRFRIRLKDSQSKMRQEFKGLNWFPVDESYRVSARLEAYPEPREVMVPNALGGHFKMKSPGVLRFALQGQEHSLQPVLNDDGSLFLIFRDASNSSDTYLAGRFLDADKPVDGQTTLDFNKAENPPCAFSPYATCPLPPEGNELTVAIKAGEKRYDHEH